MTTNIQSGDIIIFKGARWNKLFSGILKKDTWQYYFPRMIIQLVTLGRYVHSADLIYQNDRWYIVQAVLIKGVAMEVVDMNWIEAQLRDNKADLFRMEKFNQDLYMEKVTPLIGKKYSLYKLFNIGVYNIFGYDIIGRWKQNINGYFCSDLNSYLRGRKKSYLISPEDMALDDNYKRIY